MEELRPDLLGDDITPQTVEQVDERVIGPTERLDDRDGSDGQYSVDERLSGEGTGWDPNDPAIN